MKLKTLAFIVLTFLAFDSMAQNVGIGTDTPSHKLTVTEDIKVNGIVIGRGAFNNSSNTTVGKQALNNNISGLGNTAMGDQALEFTDANFNTGFGYRAIRNTTTGQQNTAFGPALGANITGSNNVGVGFQALEQTNASNNTSIGTQSLKALTSGQSNAALGYQTLLNNITGDNNAALGARAGLNNVGSANVFLGADAGSDELGSNKLYIENSNSTTPLIYGDFANDTVKVFGTLNIHDNYSFPANDGTDGQIITTDGNGMLMWKDTLTEVDPTISSDSLNIIPKWDGSNLVNGSIYDNGTNVGIGTTDLDYRLVVTDDIKINGIVIGRGAFNNSSNTTVGKQALNNNISGLGNTAMGDQALEFTDANFNTGFGYRALRLTTSGQQNTAFGPALGANITGSNNVGMGFQALEQTNASNNTSIGTQSLKALTSGQSNAALGYQTLLNNITGDNNVALGARAGLNNLGNNNVFIGYNAGSLETGSNKLYIDNSDTTDPLIYGDFDTNDVYIHGTMNISETARLTPLATAPGCGGSDAGLIYFDDTLKKLRVCDGTTWQNLH